LREAGAVSVEVYGDSELVIKQLNGQYECKSEALRSYYKECREILKSFQLLYSIFLGNITKKRTGWLRAPLVTKGVRKRLLQTYVSGTDLGVPFKQTGESPLKTRNKPKPSAPRLSTQGMAHAVVAPTAHQGGPLKVPLERAPPRSRAHASLGRAPPGSRGCAYLEQAPPRSRAPRTRAPAPVRSI
jgi:hypothetical protein